jgi:hypothetical protein
VAHSTCLRVRHDSIVAIEQQRTRRALTGIDGKESPAHC